MTTEITIKDIMAFFHSDARPMTAKEMTREWKPLSQESKDQIRNGIADGTLTYSF